VTLVNGTLLRSIQELHREKNASYRDAWKKRGEVLSILANIARKIDRLEYVVEGAPSTKAESLTDTATDLLVYCLKYQTYLADIDDSVATSLFRNSGIDKPYSEGVESFEYLLSRLGRRDEHSASDSVRNATDRVIGGFKKLEDCFSGISVQTSTAVRLGYVQELTNSAILLIVAIEHQRE
jgi:hypothetical protein